MTTEPAVKAEVRTTTQGEKFRVCVCAADFVWPNGEASRQGDTLATVALNDPARALDRAIEAGDLSAWRRFQREIWREPNTSEGMLAEAGEWIAANEPVRQRGAHFNNPEGRPRRVDAEDIFDLVSLYRRDGVPLTTTLYIANSELEFCTNPTPENLDKAWRRALKRLGK